MFFAESNCVREPSCRRPSRGAHASKRPTKGAKGRARIFARIMKHANSCIIADAFAAGCERHKKLQTFADRKKRPRALGALLFCMCDVKCRVIRANERSRARHSKTLAAYNHRQKQQKANAHSSPTARRYKKSSL